MKSARRNAYAALSLTVVVFVLSNALQSTTQAGSGRSEEKTGNSIPDTSFQATYNFSHQEVTRLYPKPANPGPYPYWAPGSTVEPGTQTTSATSFAMGWNFAFNEPGRTHATSQVNIARPATLAAGQPASFSASMTGYWQMKGYGLVRDHTISLKGAAGEKTWSVDGDQNATMNATIETSNSVTVPSEPSAELSYDIFARLNFGNENWAEMKIHMVYTCATHCDEPSHSASQLSARLICKDPLVLQRTTTESTHQEVCTICIKGWRRNRTPVEVVFPEQIDWWGKHANGIKVFAGGNDVTKVIGPMSLETWHMSGYKCPDSDSYAIGEYPWNFFIKADLDAVPGAPFAIPITVRQKRDRAKGDPPNGRFDEAKIVVNGKVAPKGISGDLVQLKLYYSDSRRDNFTAATADGERDAIGAGYRFVRVEGYVYSTQHPGTVPLKLYYSDTRHDNYTTGTKQGEQAALSSGYRFVRVEGYIYPDQQTGTVPLYDYWSTERGDNFSTATSDGVRAAKDNRYVLALVEGYILAPRDEDE